MQKVDTQTLAETQAHLPDHVRRVRETNRPLFLTSEGETAAVMLSPQAYRELIAETELAKNLECIDRGLEDIKAGRVRDAREGIREIAAEFDIKLKR
ncbi:MAG: type II toxin-antitoxin system Phd/YefM family antitoxin [Phycisphaeraceae bacterium]